jgi:phosphoheptose isomerase
LNWVLNEILVGKWDQSKEKIPSIELNINRILLTSAVNEVCSDRCKDHDIELMSQNAGPISR